MMPGLVAHSMMPGLQLDHAQGLSTCACSHCDGIVVVGVARKLCYAAGALLGCVGCRACTYHMPAPGTAVCCLESVLGREMIKAQVPGIIPKMQVKKASKILLQCVAQSGTKRAH